ncbi:MAG: hypothetical protein ABIG42_00715 [bacterium]
MAPFLTPEETKENYINAMGKDLGEIYFTLSNQLTWLYEKWNEYIELYGKKKSRIELLNNTAPSFFGMIQRIMLNDILLHIRRMTDQAGTRGRTNLSLEYLCALLKSKDEDLFNTVSGLIDQVKETSKFARKYVDKKIAHTDSGIALGHSAMPLESEIRKKIDNILDAFSAVLNAVLLRYVKAEISFKDKSCSDDALTLLHVLHDGLKVKREKEIRIQNSEYLSADFEVPDI